MIKDPDITWEGEFPYDVLKPAGVTPYSKIDEVMNAKRFFTRRHQVAEARSAFAALGKIDSRLFIDFFLYQSVIQTDSEEEEHGSSEPSPNS